MLNMRSIPWGCAFFLFRCESFGDVKLCFWWRIPFLQINGVPVPVERSWSSLKGVLNIFKSWCNFQKRQMIQFSFWWVKPFLQTNGVPSKQMAAGFLWKECYIFLRNGATFKHKGKLSFFERNVTSLKDTLHILTQYCFCCLNYINCFNLWRKQHLPEGILPG